MHRIAFVLIVWPLTTAAAVAACGEKGGPGYRGPNGKCVGWAQIGSVCGSPPTSRCTPEMTAGGAGEAAGLGVKIEALRSQAAAAPGR